MNRLLIALGSLLILLIIALSIVLIALVRQQSARTQAGIVATAVVVENQVALAPENTVSADQGEPALTAVAPTPVRTSAPSATQRPTSTDRPPTIIPSNMPTATETAAPTETAVPTETALPTATATPSETPTPTFTPTVTPSPTPTVIPSPTLTEGPAWLGYINFLRGNADLPPLSENTLLSAGSQQHSQYVMATGDLSHYQSLGGQFASAAGLDAAQNGNLAVAGYDQASDLWGIGYWISAPFHLVPMLNPRLVEVGHGVARDPSSGFKVTYTIDISTKRAQTDPVRDGVTFPITFPRDGGQMWITKYILPETPDARVACNYSNPTGAPIVAMFGTGDLEPNVEDSVIFTGDEEIPHCVLTETNYFAPTSEYGTDQQSLGRQILDKQDAIILLPQSPLEVGKTYTVFLDTDTEFDTVEWSFEVIDLPPAFR